MGWSRRKKKVMGVVGPAPAPLNLQAQGIMPQVGGTPKNQTGILPSPLPSPWGTWQKPRREGFTGWGIWG